MSSEKIKEQFQGLDRYILHRLVRFERASGGDVSVESRFYERMRDMGPDIHGCVELPSEALQILILEARPPHPRLTEWDRDLIIRQRDHMHSLRVRHGRVILPFLFFVAFPSSGVANEEWPALLAKIEKAYASVSDYRTNVEVRTYGGDGSSETDRFLYTFKKPRSIRLDFESPHQGMVIIYPDKNGKAEIRPSGFAHFLTLHLAPDNPLLRVSSGQQIDKTDMGLLIENISHSLTDERRGSIQTWDQDGLAVIRVLALNHFQKSTLTLYEFSIDTSRRLPVRVKEMTPEGSLKRTITFRNLEINNGVSESLFLPEEEQGNKKKGQRDGK